MHQGTDVLSRVILTEGIMGGSPILNFVLSIGNEVASNMIPLVQSLLDKIAILLHPED